MRHALAALGRNLAAGARLAFLMPVAPLAFRIDAAQLIALFLLSCGLDVGIDWLRYGPDADFSLAAIGSELAGLAIPFVVGSALAAATRQRDLALALPVVVLAALVPPQLAWLALAAAGQAIEDADRWIGLASDAVLLWLIVILLRCALALLAPPVRRPLLAILAAAALASPLFLPDGILPSSPWWVSYEEADAMASDPSSEPALALQRQLQDEALADLEDRSSNGTNLYFVAFAGDGDASSWLARANAAREMMDGHWGTGGHSLVYVNDPTPGSDAVRATVTHLREALQEIAAVSDPAQDVVMLYLAGRTNRDGSLRVALPGVDLVQLSGAALRGLLDEAGFEHRVVVLATCEPGPFVEALADDRTAVLAAVPPARHGCPGGGGATAFADDLFNDALPRASTLRAALELARTNARQANRGEDALPWLHVGAGVAAKLEELRNARSGGVTAARDAVRRAG